MNKERYLINELKYKHGIHIKKIKMADSGTYYIAYKIKRRECCIFKEPINDKLYCDLEDVLKETENIDNQR